MLSSNGKVSIINFVWWLVVGEKMLGRLKGFLAHSNKPLRVFVRFTGRRENEGRHKTFVEIWTV